MDHQLIVILIFAVIGIFNWLVRKGAKVGNLDKGSPPFTPQRPRGFQPIEESSESDEERMRKFLEALGVPGNAEPPRKIARPPQPPVPRIQAPVQREIPGPVAAPKRIVPPVPTPLALPIYEMAAPVGVAAPIAIASFVDPGTSNLAELQSLLKSPSSIRTAIILREVLGPPKSLQTQGGAPGLS